MTRQRGSRLIALVACVAFAGALAVAVAIQMREPGDAAPSSEPSSEPDGDRADGEEFEITTYPDDYPHGPIDSDEGRRVSSLVDRETAHLEHRLGEFTITTPDRAGLIVPIVGLTEEEADQIGALSTDNITVTARDALLSLGELDQLARHLVDELGPDNGYVNLHTDREVIQVMTPEPVEPSIAADLERSAARKLQEILDAREDPAAIRGREVHVDDLMEYDSGTELRQLG